MASLSDVPSLGRQPQGVAQTPAVREGAFLVGGTSRAEPAGLRDQSGSRMSWEAGAGGQGAAGPAASIGEPRCLTKPKSRVTVKYRPSQARGLPSPGSWLHGQNGIEEHTGKSHHHHHRPGTCGT